MFDSKEDLWRLLDQFCDEDLAVVSEAKNTLSAKLLHWIRNVYFAGHTSTSSVGRDDLTQNAIFACLLRLFSDLESGAKSREDFPTVKRFQGYIRSICLGTFADRLRRARALKRGRSKLTRDMELDLLPGNDDPAQDAALRIHFEEVLESLTAEERRVIEVFLTDPDPARVANLLDKNEKEITAIIKRFLRSFM